MRQGNLILEYQSDQSSANGLDGFLITSKTPKQTTREWTNHQRELERSLHISYWFREVVVN
jgi:hypothetical protein